VRTISTGMLLIAIPLYLLPTILGWNEKKRRAFSWSTFLRLSGGGMDSSLRMGCSAGEIEPGHYEQVWGVI